MVLAIIQLFNNPMAVPYFNSHSLNPDVQKAYEPAMSSSGSVLNDCPQRNGAVFGMEVQQTAPNNHLNTLNLCGESFHNPCSDYRFPKVPVRVIYHQEPEQSKPLGLSDKTKAQQQQSEENSLYTSQSGLRIDRVLSMAVKSDSQSHSINANHPPLDSTLKDTAGNGLSGMGQSTPQISSVIDSNLDQPVHIPEQDRIDTFSKPEAPIAVVTSQLNSEQLQQTTSSKNEFDFNASASVSGDSLTISPDKASHKAYLESEKRKAYHKAYEQSEKRKTYRKAYRKSDKGKAYHKAYEQSEKRKAYRKAYGQSEKVKASRKAYEQSEKRKAYHKAYEQSEKRKASRKAYRESDKGKAYQEAYQKVYQKAYYEVFKNTGDREQARIAGKQATAFIRESNKAKNSELESISISPLPPPLKLTGKPTIEWQEDIDHCPLDRQTVKPAVPLR